MAKKKGRWAGIDAAELRSRAVALAGLVVIVGAAAAILAVAGILGGQGGGTTESGTELGDVVLLETAPPPGLEGLEVEAREGALAPDFEVSDLEGNRHRLSDFRGQPVYLNFWATWCIPCQREMPEMQELLDRHQGELAVIAVNRAEPLNRAQAFLDNLEKLNGEPGLSFTVNALDPDDTLYRTYRGLGMPVSVFIDGQGRIVRVFNGLISLSMMEEALAEAMASSSPGTTALEP